MNELDGNNIEKLAAALAKAQGQFKIVPKTGTNPHLGNHYATLDDMINAVRAPLAANGLALVQLLGDGPSGELMLRTMIVHESGQTLGSIVSIPAPGDSRGVNALQALGSSVTYMKRYMLGAMLGIATGDDTDGEGAGERQQARSQRARPAAPVNAPAAAGNGKCAVCGATGNAHAPWCQEVEGGRVDTRKREAA